MSLDGQCSYIIDNSYLLDKTAKLNILRIIMLDTDSSTSIMEKAGTKEISINLDKCKQEVIQHIFNIVKSRVDILNMPVTN